MMSTTICITLNTLNTLNLLCLWFCHLPGTLQPYFQVLFSTLKLMKTFWQQYDKAKCWKGREELLLCFHLPKKLLFWFIYTCCLQPEQTQGWLKPLHLSMINPFFHSKPHWQQISLVVYVPWSKYSYCVAKWYVILSLPSLFVLSSTNNYILCQLYGAGLSHDVGPMHL